MTSTPRKTRPPLERDRPVRTWATLFGPSGERRAAPARAEGGAPFGGVPNAFGADGARTLTDTVELGYRVVDEYIKQGQQVAQAFAPAAWSGMAPSTDELPQLTQRVMQYGWDFAGLWFEMWSKMAATGAMPGMPVPPPPAPPAAAAAASSPVAAGSAPANGESGAPGRVVVSVTCSRPTTTALELRPNQGQSLVVHSLRAEGHDAPPIRDLLIERAEDGTLSVKVTIAPEQPAGIYNALIVDASSNLPRGTLSVTIGDQAG